jgi:hypothetical protein
MSEPKSQSHRVLKMTLLISMLKAEMSNVMGASEEELAMALELARGDQAHAAIFDPDFDTETDLRFTYALGRVCEDFWELVDEPLSNV